MIRVDSFRSIREKIPSSCGVYGLYIEPSGRWYVGKSVSVKRRLCRHFSQLRRGVHKNAMMQSSYNKHNRCGLFACMLEECRPGQASIRERVWVKRIGSYGGGFNMTDGGENGTHCESVRRKISASLIGRKRPPFSDEWRRNMSEERKTRHMSQAVRDKISQRLKGRVFTDEWKRKISETKRLSFSKLNAKQPPVTE